MKFAVRHVLPTWALGLSLGASGCQLDLDAQLVKNNNSNAPDSGASGPDAGGPPVCPPGFVCTSTSLDAGASGLDGGSLPPYSDDVLRPPHHDDGSLPTTLDGGVACLQDSDCAPDSYCSVTKVCRLSCDATLGCVVRHTGPLEVQGMLSAEGALLWTSRTTFNELRNSLHSGAIWRMAEDGTSTPVVSGLEVPQLLRVADGVIYFFEHSFVEGEMPPVLSAPLSGGTATPLLLSGGPVNNVVISASYLWWTRPTAGTAEDPLTQLWRRPRHGSPTDEHVKDLAGWALLAATDTAVVYTGPSSIRTLMLDNLNGAPPIEIDASGGWMEAVLTDHSLFARNDRAMSASIMRYGLSGQGDGENIAPPSPLYVVMATHAPWILWASQQGPDFLHPQPEVPRVVRFGRTLMDGTPDPQTLLGVSYPSSVYHPVGLFALAPWGDELVYQLEDEMRLARVRIPAFPCSSSIRCPEGSVCQPDQTCR